MANLISIYCDESCHLEHDHQPVMLFGAVWCPQEETRQHIEALRALKERHQTRGELKWTKVSRSRESFFLDAVDFFFSSAHLNFRCVVVENKAKLDHGYYNQGSHDSFYYKMYFYLLRHIISEKNQYDIYLDIKDTRSQIKIDHLKEVLSNNLLDFDRKVIRRMQHVRSKETELLQIADFLMGAIAYKHRSLTTNETKLKLINRICQLSGRS
ncbi:MAG TPA: DUF3800 domain-containing protein, partial [Brevefilum fermentans]|nr:DUF3800 domain-containing protein [Brevefilum fermentans]